MYFRFQGNEIPTAEQVELNKQLIEKLNNAQEQYLPVNIDENFLYGVYECVAKNAYGEATKTITLKKGFVPSVVNNVRNLFLNFYFLLIILTTLTQLMLVTIKILHTDSHL